MEGIDLFQLIGLVTCILLAAIVLAFGMLIAICSFIDHLDRTRRNRNA